MILNNNKMSLKDSVYSPYRLSIDWLFVDACVLISDRPNNLSSNLNVDLLLGFYSIGQKHYFYSYWKAHPQIAADCNNTTAILCGCAITWHTRCWKSESASQLARSPTNFGLSTSPQPPESGKPWCLPAVKHPQVITYGCYTFTIPSRCSPMRWKSSKAWSQRCSQAISPALCPEIVVARRLCCAWDPPSGFNKGPPGTEGLLY